MSCVLQSVAAADHFRAIDIAKIPRALLEQACQFWDALAFSSSKVKAQRDSVASQSALFSARSKTAPRESWWGEAAAFVTPKRLAGTVAFLCSPGADQITGTTVAVDGA